MNEMCLPRLLRRRALIALAAFLSGCQTPPLSPASMPVMPMLRLPPATLGRTLAVQQQVQSRLRGGGEHSAEVLLEVDSKRLQMALLTMGQIIVRLNWDGQRLIEERSAWAPAALSVDRILSDLQFALWPLTAVQEALSLPWAAEGTSTERLLRYGIRPVMYLRTLSAEIIEIDNVLQGYTLTIRTLSELAPT